MSSPDPAVDAGTGDLGPPSAAVPFPNPPALPVSTETAVLIGAGDIAMCEAIGRAESTAQLMQGLLQRTPGSIAITLGDNSNNEGRFNEYRDCFASTWGRFTLKPSPGNHDDYDEKLGHRGQAYYEFFGAAAGPGFRGFYSFDAGAWHVLSLNSEVMNHDTREDGQLAWLRADLAAANAENRCVLAYFHRPMVSSGTFAAARMRRLWLPLYAAGVELVLGGHEHFYERFAPQTPNGVADPAFGIRQIIAGTGGAHFHRATGRSPNSEVVIQETLGVLKLTLRPTDYEWQFIDIQGAVRDSGTGTCHGPPPRLTASSPDLRRPLPPF